MKRGATESRPFRRPRTRLRKWLWLSGLVLLLVSDLPQPTFLATAAQVEPSVRGALDRAVQFLCQRQTPEGSFQTDGYGRNVGVCALVGLGWASLGNTPDHGPQGAELARVVDYVLRQQSPQGLFHEANSASYGPMYGHGFATLFLAELYGESNRDDLRAAVEQAVQLIVQSQNAEGAWRYRPDSPDSDVSVTICQMMALRAARDAGFAVPAQAVDRCVAYVRSCQNTDGGFRYQQTPKDAQGQRSEFARSAAGLVTLYSAGIYDGEPVTRARTFLRQYQPTSAAKSLPPYYLYGHYYAMQAMWLQADDLSQAWYTAVRDDLLQSQLADGSWDGEQIAPEYATALAIIILQMPHTHLPIFQR